MKVAMSGSSGYIGRAVTARLAQRGDEVVALRRGRREAAAADWSPGEDWERPGALDGVDALIHLTGASIGAKRWTPARRELLRASRVQATQTLARHLAALAERPRVFVSASAIGFYGHRRGDETLTEDAARGEGYLTDLVTDWEAAAGGALGAGVRTALLRTAPVLGPGSELIDRLALPFKMGVGGTIGSGRHWFSWVSLDDVVGAVEHVLDDATLFGPVNVSAPNPVTNREFTKALGRVLHRPTLFPIPSPALRLLFGRGRADETLLASQRALPAKLEAAGYTFAYPEIESALRAALGEPVAASAAA